MNRLLGFLYAVCASLIILWAAGCGPTLSAQSAPPPGRIASLDSNDDHYDLDLSAGVAIAISCYHDGPCKNVVVSTDDASIADVKGAAFGALERNEYTRTTMTQSGVVIIGKAPGKAKVKIKTKDGTKMVYVTVIPQPALGSPSTRVANP